jgi:hypothetical protein
MVYPAAVLLQKMMTDGVGVDAIIDRKVENFDQLKLLAPGVTHWLKDSLAIAHQVFFLPSFVPSSLPSFCQAFLPFSKPSFLPAVLPSLKPPLLSSLNRSFLPSSFFPPSLLPPSQNAALKKKVMQLLGDNFFTPNLEFLGCWEDLKVHCAAEALRMGEEMQLYFEDNQLAEILGEATVPNTFGKMERRYLLNSSLPVWRRGKGGGKDQKKKTGGKGGGIEGEALPANHLC